MARPPPINKVVVTTASSEDGWWGQGAVQLFYDVALVSTARVEVSGIHCRGSTIPAHIHTCAVVPPSSVCVQLQPLGGAAQLQPLPGSSAGAPRSSILLLFSGSGSGSSPRVIRGHHVVLYSCCSVVVGGTPAPLRVISGHHGVLYSCCLVVVGGAAAPG